jgi:hypothetical protein
MARNVNDVIKKLSPARRKKVEARAVVLIAEEMTLRAAPSAQADAGAHGQKSRHRTETDLRDRKAYRHAHLNPTARR